MKVVSALYLVGFASMLVGGLFFRKPGVSLLTFAPLWRANQVCTPVGVALWAGGLAIVAVGILIALIT